MALVRRLRPVKRWDVIADFTHAIGYGYILKRTIPTASHAGATTTRMVLRDADGNEVSFPISLGLETTFHEVDE